MFQALKLKVIREHPRAKLPSRETPGSVGYDLYSVDTCPIPPWGHAVIDTGLKIEIPSGYYGRIASKSGLAANHSLEVGAGVVDPDYRGEVKVLLRNHSNYVHFVTRGAPIAQIVFEKIAKPRVVEVDSLNCTERGNRGMGKDWKESKNADIRAGATEFTPEGEVF